jgi:hypothetical protein
MSEFENGTEQAGFRVNLWRGERMCLVGFDVKNPEPRRQPARARS